MRPVRVLALLAILPLLAPLASAGAGDLMTSGATGSGVEASGSGILDLRLGASSGASMLISGASARLTVVDEVAEGTVRFPVDPGADINALAAGEARRYVDDFDLANFDLSLSGVLQDDARSLFLPQATTVEIDVNGRYEAETVEEHLLEASHSRNEASTLDAWQYYEYRAPQGLDVSWSGDAEAIAQGDFEVYFWGVSFTYADSAQSGSATTGHSLERSDGELGAFEFVKDEHFRYATLSVTDGTLQYAQASGQADFFATEVETAPDEDVTFRGTHGTLQTAGGRVTADGGVIEATGGSYLWSSDGERMAVSVLRAPAIATGTSAVFAPASEPWVPSAWAIYAISALVLLAAAALYAYPAARGRTLASPGSTWRERRADGYASMAAAAETAGRPRLAAFWMACALRVVPADPLRMVDLAILCAQAGQARKALRLHEQAHGWLLDAGSGEQAAHNAYEAAKAAARLGRKSSALDWLRMALESEPGLIGRIGREPAFSGLRTEADYASLTVGGR